MPLKTINIEGQVYFVTSKIYRNLNIFVYDRFCETVINTLEFMKKQNKFKLLGYIIMPDHLHLVIWPMGKNTISDIMRDFKKYTSRQIINYAIKSEKCGSPDPHSLVRLDREIQPSQIKNYKCDQEKRPSPENKLNYPTFSELLKIFTVNTKKQYYKLWQSHNWIEQAFQPVLKAGDLSLP